MIDRERILVARNVARRGRPDLARQLTSEWFDEEREFFDDKSQLAAACCGRRAGKTRGVCRDLVRDLVSIRGARLLYLNSTRNEAERIAWYGNRNDGVAALVEQLGIDAKLDRNALTIHVRATDAWLFMRGADDESELRKALGSAYHKVYWDEAQKIPSKLAQPIREVLLPALLDFGGKLRLTGTPTRQMAGLFYDVTRPETDRRLPGWRVHGWNLLSNPFFGATHEERWARGITGLQDLYGGQLVAPIDSPIVQREAFGRWVREDAAYVYAVHRVPEASLLYAPSRARPDGFPDLTRALADLPWPAEQAQYALGCDLGYHPDPFALVLWAWHGHDPKLYEVCSFRRTHMTSDEQNAALKEVMALVRVGLVVADAAGGGKPTVTGWSREWIERYNLPIVEAQKQHKYTAIETLNNDLLNGRLALRDGGCLYEEMSQLQWSSVVSGNGKLVEDPTMPNDTTDASLYAHRHSYQFRWRPADVIPALGTPARAQRDEDQLEADLEEDEYDGQ